MSWEYICVFHSYLERMKMLNNEQFGELIRALLIYSETGKPPEEMSAGKHFFCSRQVSLRRISSKEWYAPADVSADLPSTEQRWRS